MFLALLSYSSRTYIPEFPENTFLYGIVKSSHTASWIEYMNVYRWFKKWMLFWKTVVVEKYTKEWKISNKLCLMIRKLVAFHIGKSLYAIYCRLEFTGSSSLLDYIWVNIIPILTYVSWLPSWLSPWVPDGETGTYSHMALSSLFIGFRKRKILRHLTGTRSRQVNKVGTVSTGRFKQKWRLKFVVIMQKPLNYMRPVRYIRAPQGLRASKEAAISTSTYASYFQYHR